MTSSGVARAVEYPRGGRAATMPAHETIDAAPPRHTRTRGRTSSSIAAMALLAATSCGGASASKRDVPPEWPPAPPTATVEASTTSPAAAIEAPTMSPAALAVSETTEPWSDGMSDTAPNRFVEEKGIRFAYRAFGRKPGVPLLLLAPLRGTMDSWDPRLTDAFAQDRPLILFDTVGVGLTGGDARTTVADMATDAGAFIDALRALSFTDPNWLTGHVDVLGFSLGGFVAQQLAMNRPDVVERVVLAATAPRGGEGFAMPPREIATSETADPQTPDDVLFLLFAGSDASRAAGQAFLARLGGRQHDRDGSVTNKTILAQLAAMKAWGAAPRTGRYSYLSGVKQPVLVADGEADVVMPTTNSRALAQSLPRARLVIYPDSAHGFLFQYPDAFAKDVAAFLRRP
jgi:pimeloyl-ACP methyl ester carboxylesterase